MNKSFDQFFQPSNVLIKDNKKQANFTICFSFILHTKLCTSAFADSSEFCQQRQIIKCLLNVKIFSLFLVKMVDKHESNISSTATSTAWSLLQGELSDSCQQFLYMFWSTLKYFSLYTYSISTECSYFKQRRQCLVIHQMPIINWGFLLSRN